MDKVGQGSQYTDLCESVCVQIEILHMLESENVGEQPFKLFFRQVHFEVGH